MTQHTEGGPALREQLDGAIESRRLGPWNVSDRNDQTDDNDGDAHARDSSAEHRKIKEIRELRFLPKLLDLPVNYALAQLNGAYCPLLLPLVSFQEKPNAFNWLCRARASVTLVFAGCPVFDSFKGSVVFGSMPIAGSADMLTNDGALTDHLTPSRSKRIGADSIPTKFLIIPASAAMGPPAAPLATATIASRCSGRARSSTITPADQSPLLISAGVNPTTMKPRPSSATSPNLPCSILNPIANVHEPLLGFPDNCVRMHGQTKSQLHVS